MAILVIGAILLNSPQKGNKGSLTLLTAAPTPKCRHPDRGDTDQCGDACGYGQQRPHTGHDQARQEVDQDEGEVDQGPGPGQLQPRLPQRLGFLIFQFQKTVLRGELVEIAAGELFRHPVDLAVDDGQAVDQLLLRHAAVALFAA